MKFSGRGNGLRWWLVGLGLLLTATALTWAVALWLSSLATFARPMPPDALPLARLSARLRPLHEPKRPRQDGDGP